MQKGTLRVEVNKLHVWYVECVIETPALVSVVATSEDEARARAVEGAWLGVDIRDEQYNNARMMRIQSLKEGPGIN